MSGPRLIRKDFLNSSPCDNNRPTSGCNPTVIRLCKKKIVIGRAHHANYRIISQKVSNIHLTVTCGNKPNEWLFTSNKSKKGTFVNDLKIKDGPQYLMKDGDVIRLGVVLNEPINEFVCQLPSLTTEKRNNLLGSEKTNCLTTEKRNNLLGSEKTNVATISKEELHVSAEQALRKKLEAAESREKNLRTELKRKKDLTEDLKRNIKALEAKIKIMNQENAIKVLVRKELEAAVRREDSLQAELRQRISLEASLNADIIKMKQDNDDNMLRKQQELVACNKSLNETRSELMSARNKFLIQQQRAQESIIEKKKIKSALQYSLYAGRVLQEFVVPECSQSHESYEVAAATGLTSIVTYVLKTELKCGICIELVIEAVTLECSHTFCSHCIISEWNQTGYSCQICKRSFTMFTKTSVFDNIIEKVLDLLSPKLKERRLKLVSSRECNFASESLKGTPVVSASESLWPRLKRYCKHFLQVEREQRQQQQQLVESTQESIAEIESQKMETALYYCSFACNVLQELVTVNKSSENPALDLSNALTSVLESELQCGICTEMVIEAMTLQCSHMFCRVCIQEWSRLKNECPICRQPVRMFTKTLALDRFLNKVLDFLSPQAKATRLETMAERGVSNEVVESGRDSRY